MRKATRNYFLALVMLLLALFQAVSGFVLWLGLPRGGGDYRVGRIVESFKGLILLWSRQTWVDLHNWVAVALAVMVIIHLILHWKWIVYVTKTLGRQEK